MKTSWLEIFKSKHTKLTEEEEEYANQLLREAGALK
jgi:hypothetical protein